VSETSQPSFSSRRTSRFSKPPSIVLVEVITPQFLVSFLVAQDMVDDDKNIVSNGNHGFLFAMATS